MPTLLDRFTYRMAVYLTPVIAGLLCVTPPHDPHKHIAALTARLTKEPTTARLWLARHPRHPLHDDRAGSGEDGRKRAEGRCDQLTAPVRDQYREIARGTPMLGALDSAEHDSLGPPDTARCDAGGGLWL